MFTQSAFKTKTIHILKIILGLLLFVNLTVNVLVLHHDPSKAANICRADSAADPYEKPLRSLIQIISDK